MLAKKGYIDDWSGDRIPYELFQVEFPDDPGRADIPTFEDDVKLASEILIMYGDLWIDGKGRKTKFFTAYNDVAVQHQIFLQFLKRVSPDYEGKKRNDTDPVLRSLVEAKIGAQGATRPFMLAKDFQYYARKISPPPGDEGDWLYNAFDDAVDHLDLVAGLFNAQYLHLPLLASYSAGCWPWLKPEDRPDGIPDRCPAIIGTFSVRTPKLIPQLQKRKLQLWLPDKYGPCSWEKEDGKGGKGNLYVTRYRRWAKMKYAMGYKAFQDLPGGTKMSVGPRNGDDEFMGFIPRLYGLPLCGVAVQSQR
jgi:hypothetical protein